MARKTTQLVVLIGLLAVLVAVVGYDLRVASHAGSVPSQTAAAVTRQTTGDVTARALPIAWPEVRLDMLAVPRDEPAAAVRNPFRVEPPPPPSMSPPRRGGTNQGVVAPDAPAPPPPPPPIPLRLIGLVEARGGVGRIAVLSDGRDVFYGREGDIIEGRYRIIQIGIESVDIGYVDGRGSQRLRLSGS